MADDGRNVSFGCWSGEANRKNRPRAGLDRWGDGASLNGAKEKNKNEKEKTGVTLPSPRSG